MLTHLLVARYSYPAALVSFLPVTSIALLGLNLHKEYKKNPERISALLQYMASCGSSVGGVGGLSKV